MLIFTILHFSTNYFNYENYTSLLMLDLYYFKIILIVKSCLCFFIVKFYIFENNFNKKIFNKANVMIKHNILVLLQIN